MSLKHGTVRKLGNILQELKPLAEQGKVEGFFNNVKNADKLGGLVGDIHDAMIHYQVNIYKPLISAPLMFAPDFVTTRSL